MSAEISGERALISFWDGGRCHLTRALTVAEEMQNRGIIVGAITSDKYKEEVRAVVGKDGLFVVPNRPETINPPPYDFPLYSHAFTHAQRLRGLGFNDAQWLEQITTKEIEVIDRFKPDVIVNDYRDTIRSSAECKDIPVVAITHTTGNVDGRRFVWWTSPPEDANIPNCLDSFNEVRANLGLRAITDERYMFSGDHNVIPSIEEVDPLRVKSPSSTYVGVLSKWQRTDIFTSIAKTYGPKVFSYASGELTRPQYGLEEMLGDVISQERSMGFYVVAGDRNRYSEDVLRARRNGRAMMEAYIPAYEATKDSDLVLTQGGNGTVMLSLLLGKPMVCIGPPQSDCTSIFRGVELNHAGIMLNHSDGPLERRPAPDLGEGTDIFGYWETSITSSRINEAIQHVLADQTYTENAVRLGQKIQSLGGVKRAVDIIVEVIRENR